jgi:hypothetical protein
MPVKVKRGGDKVLVSMYIRLWFVYLVMLIFVEPAVELIVAVVVRGRGQGRQAACIYLYVCGSYTG